jgi:DNA repair protein RadC
VTSPMASVPSRERPRKRLLALGAEALTERELLALVIRNGARGVGALDLAAELLAEHGSLRILAATRPEELASKCGIVVTKAAALVAAFELGRRVGGEDETVTLRGPGDVADVARRKLAGLRRERVLVIVCNSANLVVRTETVSEGSMDRALVPVREILNAVLRHDGRAFAIAHNHPGGDPEPSDAERRATVELREAATVVGLRFLGHVVVGRGGWREATR